MLSFSVSASEQRRRYAAFVDKILRGAKPADLPIEQPTQFEFWDKPEDREGACDHHPAIAAPARG